MFIKERSNKKEYEVVIEPVDDSDYKAITKKRYFFNWKTEKENDVFKLRMVGSKDILGLVSILCVSKEERIKINLLAVSKENRGKKKQYERICGCLIAFVSREAVKLYGVNACVSLIPKTKLKEHYITQYGMEDAGKSVYLAGIPIQTILNNYDL